MRFISGNGHDHTGTLTSSSSGHSSNDDRWYEILEVPEEDNKPKHQPRYQKPPQYAHHPKLTTSNSVPVNNSRPLSVHEPKIATYAKLPVPRSTHSNGSADDATHTHEIQLSRNLLKSTTPDGSQLDNCSIEPIYNLSRKSNDDEISNGIQNMDLSQIKRSPALNNGHKPKSSKLLSLIAFFLIWYKREF